MTCRLFEMEIEMEKEIWKDIPGYEGKYQVSNLGNVKSLSRTIYSANQSGPIIFQTKERILSPGKHDKCGHLSVVLNNPRKSYLVHKLVMLAFIGTPPPGKVVCHNNGDATDNRLENLRYDTQTENVLDVLHSGRPWKKLSENDVQAIRFGAWCGISTIELGLMFCVAHQTISKVLTGRTFSWLK